MTICQLFHVPHCVTTKMKILNHIIKFYSSLLLNIILVFGTKKP